MDGVIEGAVLKCHQGEPLTKEEMVELLAIPLGSPQDDDLRRAAREMAAEKTGDVAHIWGAFGADYARCTMNCHFCSFGDKWKIIDHDRVYTDDEILSQAKEYAQGGAQFIVLRTTEFYDLDRLEALARKIKEGVPGKYELILNIGEFNITQAETLNNAGVEGIYHALRLREGQDTPFKPQMRRDTLDSICRSPLKLISLVEPLGNEHSNEEIAEAFLTVLEYKAVISGAMARIPVPGTPLGNEPQMDDHRLAQIIAVLRLSGGDVVKDICVHPASAEALASGANVVVVETGAVPRDRQVSDGEWRSFSMEEAREGLIRAGYQVLPELKG